MKQTEIVALLRRGQVISMSSRRLPWATLSASDVAGRRPGTWSTDASGDGFTPLHLACFFGQLERQATDSAMGQTRTQFEPDRDDP